MRWENYRDIWPNADASQFMASRPHRWHVQDAGPTDAPALLLLHGAGGATHSWRDLLPVLSQNYRVIAPDLPGHGFTRLGVMQRSSLPLMAQDIASLLAKLEVVPLAIVGHSAGAALALQLALLQPPRAIIGLNAALDDFKGVSGWLFPMMAKVLALNPLVSATFARLARNTSVQNLVEGTGSHLDKRGLDLYRATLGERSHIDGTLTMMAQWRLSGLRDRLPGLDVPTLFLAGGGDLTVPPETSSQARTMMPDAHFELIADLGHLMHEEAPEMIASKITSFLKTL